MTTNNSSNQSGGIKETIKNALHLNKDSSATQSTNPSTGVHSTGNHSSSSYGTGNQGTGTHTTGTHTNVGGTHSSMGGGYNSNNTAAPGTTNSVGQPKETIGQKLERTLVPDSTKDPQQLAQEEARVNQSVSTFGSGPNNQNTSFSHTNQPHTGVGNSAHGTHTTQGAYNTSTGTGGYNSSHTSAPGTVNRSGQPAETTGQKAERVLVPDGIKSNQQIAQETARNNQSASTFGSGPNNASTTGALQSGGGISGPHSGLHNTGVQGTGYNNQPTSGHTAGIHSGPTNTFGTSGSQGYTSNASAQPGTTNAQGLPKETLKEKAERTLVPDSTKSPEQLATEQARQQQSHSSSLSGSNNTAGYGNSAPATGRPAY